MIDVNKITTEKDKVEIEQLFRKFQTTPRHNNLIIRDFTNFINQIIFPIGTEVEEIEDYFNTIYPGGLTELKK